MKYLLSVIIFIFSYFIFMILEYGKFSSTLLDSILPLSFAAVVTFIYLSGNLRKQILWLVIVSLSLMVLFYLFNYLTIANWLGSLGMGVLVILICSYFTKLIKDGHI